MYTKKWFSYDSTKTYVVGTQNKCLNEMIIPWDSYFEYLKHTMLKLIGKKIVLSKPVCSIFDVYNEPSHVTNMKPGGGIYRYK